MTKNLTLRFFQAAIVYFLIACAIGVLMLAKIIHPKFQIIIAHAHLALLGWISMTIMGAMYEQVKTLTGAELHSKKLADISFWLMNLGLVGFFLSFYRSGYSINATIFGFVLVSAVYIFAYNIFKTTKKKKATSLTIRFYEIAVAYFVVACTLGVVMTIKPYLIPRVAHGHLALIGWVSLTIIGAMYQMLPMVIMKDLYSQRLGNITYGLMNIGIIGFFLGLITTMYSLITLLFALIILIAGITFAYNMFKTATRKELKMALPIDAFEAKFFEAAVIYFIIACAIGVLMAIKPDLIFKTFRAHAHLVLLGWVSITIFGGMYHLVPMLVWTEIFSKKGKEPLPSSFKDLYSQKLGNASFWLMNIGVVGIFLSLIAARGLTIIFGIVVVLAALIFAYDMFKTMAKA